MLVVVEIAPHERHDAIEAYRRHLTDEQVAEIEDAPEENWVTLHMGGGPTRVTVVDAKDEYFLDSIPAR
jgi:hypothetical protein